MGVARRSGWIATLSREWTGQEVLLKKAIDELGQAFV
jgi:hypothetical protein